MKILIRSRLTLFVIGLITFIVGERYLGSETYRWLVSGGGIGLTLFAILIAALGVLRAKGNGRTLEVKSWCYILLYQAIIVLGVATYFGYVRLMGTSATPDTFAEKALLACWLISFMVGCFSGIGAELSFTHSGLGAYAEPKRVHRATLNWSMVGMLMAVLFCFNYAAAKKDKAWDWSYLKATTPSQSTIAIVGSVEGTVEVAVFYARDNEVLPHVKEYFDFLKNKSGKIDLKYVDKDMHPTVAEDFKASRNGQVILRFKDQRERIDIGDDVKSARNTLKKLDGEVQKVVLRLAQEKKRLYFTRGHGEMSWIGEDDPLRSIDLLEKVLRSQNYSLRLFGVAEGSAKEVPDDADAVIVAGPTQTFMQAEADALEAYINKGGKLFVMLDVAKSLHDTAEITTTSDDPLQKLLAKFGLKFVNKTLANENNYISATRSDVDRWFIFSNTFSTHESVSSLARNEERVALMLFQSGFFDVTEKVGKWKATTTVRSMADTFIDANRNYAFDKGEEQKTFSIGAASTLTVEDQMGGKSKEARVVVLADANVISDAIIRNRGNAIFALDTIRWLAGQSEISGEPASEEDIKIQHTRKEDVVWFNITVGVVPMLILGVGFIATRRKRRKGK